MKIVINTQYRENYAAHDWNGQGECPQQWKNKGGDIYIIENLTKDQAKMVLNNRTHELYNLIECSNDYVNNYIVSIAVCEDNIIVCEDWECPNVIMINEDNYINTRITKNDEYGYLNKKIIEKHESFIMKEKGTSENYQIQYLLADGNLVKSENINDYLN